MAWVVALHRRQVERVDRFDLIRRALHRSGQLANSSHRMTGMRGLCRLSSARISRRLPAIVSGVAPSSK